MLIRSLSGLLLVLAVLLVFAVVGCVAPASSPAGTAAPSASTGADNASSPAQQPLDHVVTGQPGIDAALEAGPVFLEFGAEWCYWCNLEKPVVGNLSVEYPGIAFLSADTDESPGLAKAFYVKGIPQLEIIVRKNPDGSYLYIDPTGNTTTDRYASRIVGYHTHDELKPLLGAAVAAR